MTDKTQKHVPQPPTGFRKAVIGGSLLNIGTDAYLHKVQELLVGKVRPKQLVSSAVISYLVKSPLRDVRLFEF